jgi:DNA-directed RNA polymerase specialized sigma24 family protein
MVGGQQSDEELARLAAGGDERAFSDLYNRYVPEVFDYAIRISRDRDIAALVLQSAFLRLYQTLQSGTLPPSIKLQLFAGAHHDLAERMRGRRMPVIEGEEAFVVADAARLARVVPGPELHELTRLAWQAARELRPEEYELLDLSIRRGLSDEEIASFMRTRAQSVQVRLDRARGLFEESFSSLVLLSYGRRTCLDLDFLVAEDKWSSSLRRRILQHMASCTVCQNTRRAYISAAEALAAIGVAPAPPGWQAIMLSRLLKAREGGEAAPTGPLLPGGVPAPEPVSAEAATAPLSTSPYTARPMTSYSTNPGMFERFADFGGRGPLVAVFGGGLLILLMIFGALCSAGAFDSGSSSSKPTGTATVTRTATRTRTATVTATLTATEAPPEATETLEPTEAPTTEPTSTPAPVLPTDTPVPVPPTSTPPVSTATP